jgi:hypothetical protein
VTPPTAIAKTKYWWWLAAASFAVSLVILAPAALIEWATRQSPGLRLAADSGTVWSGRGRVAIATDGNTLTIPLAWRFDPRALLNLRLGYFVDASAPALSGSTRIGWRFGDIELRETALSADARLLAAAHRAVALFAPAGKIGLQQSGDERISISPAADDSAWRVTGAMAMRAEQLVLGGIVNAPAGSHELKIQADGTIINIAMLRSSGPLKLEGTGALMLAAPRRFTFSGFATAAADAPAALKQLGPLLADGRQRIELSTNW